MKRIVEHYVLPVVYLAILGLMAWAAALAWVEDCGALPGPVLGGVLGMEPDLDCTPRPDMANTPPWQPVSVTGGVRSDVVRPSEVGR